MNESIKPLPLGEPLTPAAPADKQPDQLSLDDRVTEWADAHPEGQDFDPNASALPTAEQQPTAPPPGEPPAPTQPQGEAKPSDAKAPSTPPTAQPKDAQPPQAQPPPQVVEKPREAEPVRFSLDARYTFAEGAPPWTGQQIVDALRERQTLLPAKTEADTYQEVFGMPAAQAKELWAPNIAWMRQNPRAVEMIANMIDDPLKAQYLLDCSTYWDSPEGQNLRANNPRFKELQAQQTPKMSPEVEARFKQLEAQNKALQDAENARKKQVYMDRVARDLNVAFERYPYLRDNPDMVKALLARAYWINAGDDSENAKGVIEALEMEKDLYDAKLAALDQAKQIAAGAAAPPETPPPLLGTAGASPQATPGRPVAAKAFKSLDDAVDEWMTNPPSQFR